MKSISFVNEFTVSGAREDVESAHQRLEDAMQKLTDIKLRKHIKNLNEKLYGILCSY